MAGLPHGNVGNEALGKEPLPKVSDPRWQLAGKVSNLYIYPVKSFKGVSLSKAKIGKKIQSLVRNYTQFVFV